VRLLLLHPEVPSCDQCEQFIHDPGRGWQPLKKRGSSEPEPRPAGTATPCGLCPKIPKPCPATGRKSELSERNWQTYLHYLQCKAVGEFPPDALVRRNAGWIRMIEDQVQREQAAGADTALLTVLARKL
jgi:hypothetical protein